MGRANNFPKTKKLCSPIHIDMGTMIVCITSFNRVSCESRKGSKSIEKKEKALKILDIKF